MENYNIAFVPVRKGSKSIPFKNIRLVPPATNSVYDVFNQSFISVSIFSSTIIESIVHNVIPFIFNPTSMPHYYPDLDKEGLGIEAKSLGEAKEKITLLVKDALIIRSYQKNIIDKRHEFFTNSGEKAVQSIVATILNNIK